MKLVRSSGVQLHPTSLPKGRLGAEAYAFVDWLADAGQSWWQMLPLGPPDRYGSPYKAKSAFAAWPGLLARAARGGHEGAGARLPRAQRRTGSSDWIAPRPAADALADQVRFDREWAALRRYALDRGVKLIGDVPIYVAPGSADHRAHPELFQDGAVAGTPPDAFTDKGQLWGNPLYDWPALQRRGYRWWVERLRRTFDLYDLARVDHFRGFVSYWSVPAQRPPRAVGALEARARAARSSTPRRARARRARPDRRGPRRDHAGGRAAARRPRLPGHGDPAVPLRPGPALARTTSPTTASTRSSTRAPTTTTRCAAGTSRCPATAGRASTRRSGAGDGTRTGALIALAFSSRAELAMVQTQDVLGLGSEARMNMPGTAKGSWKWRLREGALTPTSPAASVRRARPRAAPSRRGASPSARAAGGRRRRA